MASAVLRPSTPCLGACKITSLSCAVLSLSASKEICTPAQMAVPTSAPVSSSTVKVVAVPKSTTTQGSGIWPSAQAAFAARSLPSCRGCSVLMFTPVFTPEDKSILCLIPNSAKPCITAFVTVGTTEPTIAWLHCAALTPNKSNNPFNSMAVCTPVLRISVAIGATKTHSSPLNPPILI